MIDARCGHSFLGLRSPEQVMFVTTCWVCLTSARGQVKQMLWTRVEASVAAIGEREVAKGPYNLTGNKVVLAK